MVYSTTSLILQITLFVKVLSTDHTHNDITVIDPNKSTSWRHSSTSYRIAWTQTNHAFKWDIMLYSVKTSQKILDIRNSVNEYKEKVMTFYWLMSRDVSSGRYFIRVKESNVADVYGDSQPFEITENGNEVYVNT